MGVGESYREGFAPGEMPGATAATGRIAQFPQDSQCDQCRSPTTWCFPLAPESGPQSQADPAPESNQHLGCFAEAEIAAPAPHIWDQFFHCRLDADALGPSRDLPDSLLEPFQRLCGPTRQALASWGRSHRIVRSTNIAESSYCDSMTTKRKSDHLKARLQSTALELKQEQSNVLACFE